MEDLLTTPSLILLTLLSLAACVVAIGRLFRKGAGRGVSEGALLAICAIGSAALFVYRWRYVYGRPPPVEAHVDGLLLIAALFAAAVLFLGGKSRLPGITPFATPVLTLILAWAICASRFTFQLFNLDSPVKTVHRVGVYLGALFIAVAATAAVMYLYAHRRLRRKADPSAQSPLASLEKIERTIIQSSALGFALLTLGLITGVVIVESGPTRLGPGWWYSPKVVLATAVWLIFAVVMNVRHATRFRGARAAWLSIAGLVLLLATFGVVVNAMPPTQHTTESPSAVIHGKVP